MGFDAEKRRKVIRYALWALVILLSIPAVMSGLSMADVERLQVNGVVSMDEQWTTECDAQTGAMTYSAHVEESTESRLFCIKTRMSAFQVLLDGEAIYTFSDPFFRRGSNVHTVRIPAASQGMLLSVSVPQDVQKTNWSSYIGTDEQVALHLIRTNLYALIFTPLAICIGLIVTISNKWVAKNIFENKDSRLRSFGLFILSSGIWVLTDSDLLLFYTDHFAVVSLISFASFMLMPVFLLEFIGDTFGKTKITQALCAAFGVVAAVYLVNYRVQLVPNWAPLFVTHLLCIATLVVVCVLNYRRLRATGDRAGRWFMIGFCLMFVFALGALALFIFDGRSEYAAFFCMGVLLLVACLCRVVYVDITERIQEKENAMAYKRLAYTDIMTGLRNRAAYAEERQADDGHDAARACIVLDINNLKQINDQCGHHIGDHVIIHVAKAIQSVFDKKGSCYRNGGDEFLVLLKDGGTEAQITAALNEVRRRIVTECPVEEPKASIAAGYVIRRPSETLDELVQRADARMYEEKRRMKADLALEK